PGPDDTVVTLGDYIDWGPDSRSVLDQLTALGERCTFVPLLGNHEKMLLAAREGRSDLQFWLKFGGRATLASYGLSEEPKNSKSRSTSRTGMRCAGPPYPRPVSCTAPARSPSWAIRPRRLGKFSTWAR